MTRMIDCPGCWGCDDQDDLEDSHNGINRCDGTGKIADRRTPDPLLENLLIECITMLELYAVPEASDLIDRCNAALGERDE